mmetsp:Transcript_25926/g.29932  ORF Transcript_25926/g.29932 Transcript_25926/m.29932 type:complete len:126 (-) Transcript_25926:79-456(-)|eukprot:CAMPEP_0168340496 /NCGR_PEP_ID=MMETSP0213-20121227/14095_1 /TAXON_ID=151035 /ORGANISM="Euplotes harpa, Strain FSP1.4" /LENGTH=125 /DNA_ID=CAMNT_0008346737 /DNA_START=6 /DNA_END=383 /DNA_ORIENTATION=+
MDHSLPGGSMHDILVVGDPECVETCFADELLKRNNIPYRLYNPLVEPNSEEYVKSLQAKFGMNDTEFIVLSGKFLSNYFILESKERKHKLIEYLTSADPQDSGDDEDEGNQGGHECYEGEGEGAE